MKRSHRVGRVLGLAALLGALCTTAAAAASPAPAVKRAAAISPSRCAANRAAGTIKFLSVFGYDASPGIIDVYVARKLGYFSDLCLNVQFIVPAANQPIYAEVSSGAATITGEGSAADVLEAVGDGDNFTGIATYGDTSDYAILTRSSIKNLHQLEGETLGYHSVLPVVLTEMLQRAGVDVQKVHEVNDTAYDPAVLIHGPYQALQAYQSNEPFTLDADGYQKDFSEWKPSQFGVKGTFNIQVVNNSFLKAHRGAVSDFLRAELHAFSYCAAHASTCINLDAKAPGNLYFVPSHALLEWNYEVRLAEQNSLPGKGIGVESAAEWTPELRTVTALHIADHTPTLKAAEDVTLAASLYDGTHLIWP